MVPEMFFRLFSMAMMAFAVAFFVPNGSSAQAPMALNHEVAAPVLSEPGQETVVVTDLTFESEVDSLITSLNDVQEINAGKFNPYQMGISESESQN